MATLAFLVPFSMVFVVGGLLPEEFGWVSSVIIILVAAATLLADLRYGSTAVSVGRFAGVAGILFLLEYIGVNTGYPFGRYAYTAKLGLRLAGVPVAIAFAWYGSLFNAWRIASSLNRSGPERSPLAIALFAGVLTVGLDVALEPMAGFIEGYWRWSGDTVPLQNYVSWFLLSSTAVYVLERGERGTSREAVKTPIHLFLFGFQFILFLLTDIVNGYPVASLVGSGVVLGAVAVNARARSMSPHLKTAGR
jgi:uncharacterized membrane protein